jgi:hypothetical protein
MKQVDWDRCTKPLKMLEALRASGHATQRKLRLFTVAACRRIWPLLADGRSRQAVEVAERFADGAADADELAAAETPARQAAAELYPEERIIERRPPYRAAAAAWAAAAQAPDLVDRVAIEAVLAVPDTPGETAAQAALLRCIFGPLLFRPPPPVASAVLAWSGGMVGRLAAGVYAERDFTQGRMGVLADAAEEAGLDDAELLAHLRSPGRHARGCWAVDLLLGRA